MPSEIPARHRALADPSRVRVLGALVDADESLDAGELARRVGLHANTVRFHLGVLADAGLVASAVEARSEPGRPRVLYAPTAEGAGGDGEDYRFLARMLASALDDVPDRDAVAERAGHAWGRFLVERRAPDDHVDAETATAEILRLLDEQGFAPQTDGSTVRMCRCPFKDLAESHGAVICSLHLGVLRGALEELRAPVRAEALRPFAEPGVCLVELATD
ncbi:MAG TPA: helix-turn-helix domain-containing protein [Gaiellaceae bacterium]|nr:helix-turn-helix domain-containing protein [Gaiellaceae bacterium]